MALVDLAEALFAAGLLVLVAALLAWLIWRPRPGRLLVVAVGCWLMASATAATVVGRLMPPRTPESAVENRPIQVVESDYATSKTCEACHPREYATWHRSYHRTMTQVATPETALGDFSGAEIDYAGDHYKLLEQDGRLWVELPDPEWSQQGPAPRVRRQVVLMTGSHHDQDYWFEGGRGDRGLQLLPFDWSRREGRWVPFHSTFLLPPGTPEAAPFGTWNLNCILCHTTRGYRAVESSPDGQTTYRSTVNEFGIACEACHGPAAEHVRYYRNPLRRLADHIGLGPDEAEAIVNPAHLDHDRGSQVCGSCHAVFVGRRSVVEAKPPGEPFRLPWKPGEDIHQARVYFQPRYLDPDYPATDRERHETILQLRENAAYRNARFWDDGMLRVSGREFTAMLEAPCFERGTMSCMSCHQLHQKDDDPRSEDEWANDMLAEDKQGNEACLQCHDGFRATEALTAHTHHEVGSSGSLCYNCHMPFTVYGVQKAIRVHQIVKPSARESLKQGRPNACNQCHLNQTVAWAAQKLEAWYGQRQPSLSAEDREVAAGALWSLKGRAGLRALTAWSFGWKDAMEASGADWMLPYLGQLLMDPYYSVRFVAYHALRNHSGFEDFEYDFLEPGTEQYDAYLRVRIEASERFSKADHPLQHEVLGTDLGGVDYHEMDAIVRERDHTPVTLLE